MNRRYTPQQQMAIGRALQQMLAGAFRGPRTTGIGILTPVPLPIGNGGSMRRTPPTPIPNQPPPLPGYRRP